MKVAIDEGKPVADVRVEQEAKSCLVAGVDAVKLASQYQKRLSEQGSNPPKKNLQALKLSTILKHVLIVLLLSTRNNYEVATTLVHDTYLQRFEGVEGDLIAAALVEDLEKDFNVATSTAISKDTG